MSGFLKEDKKGTLAYNLYQMEKDSSNPEVARLLRDKRLALGNEYSDDKMEQIGSAKPPQKPPQKTPQNKPKEQTPAPIPETIPSQSRVAKPSNFNASQFVDNTLNPQQQKQPQQSQPQKNMQQLLNPAIPKPPPKAPDQLQQNTKQKKRGKLRRILSSLGGKKPKQNTTQPSQPAQPAQTNAPVRAKKLKLTSQRKKQMAFNNYQKLSNKLNNLDKVTLDSIRNIKDPKIRMQMANRLKQQLQTYTGGDIENADFTKSEKLILKMKINSIIRKLEE